MRANDTPDPLAPITLAALTLDAAVDELLAEQPCDEIGADLALALLEYSIAKLEAAVPGDQPSRLRHYGPSY